MMKNKRTEKISVSPKYVALFISALCIASMILTFHSHAFSDFLRNTIGVAVVPFENGVAATGSYLTDRVKELSRIRELLKENEELKEQVAELTMENTALQQERYELTELRELYGLDDTYSGYEKIGARIISKDGGNWFSYFIVNKGEKDGVAVDMNVLSGAGLVGRVDAVGYNWARVISVINDSSNVSGMLLSTQDNLIVSGNLETYARGVITFAQLIDEENLAAAGDKIVTSNISDKFLPGILIGYVDTISDDSNNLTKSGTLTPAVDFRHLNDVLIITRVKDMPENPYTGGVDEK